MNIFVRDEACQVPDQNIHPKGEISLSNMDILMMDYFSPITIQKHEIHMFSYEIWINFKVRKCMMSLYDFDCDVKGSTWEMDSSHTAVSHCRTLSHTACYQRKQCVSLWNIQLWINLLFLVHVYTVKYFFYHSSFTIEYFYNGIKD